MKVTKNMVTIVSGLWTRYSIKKNLYANARIDMTPPCPCSHPPPPSANVIIECPLIGCPKLRHNSIKFRKANNFQKQQNKICQTSLCTTTWTFTKF